MQVAGQETVTYQYDGNSRLTDINTLINGVAAGFSLSYDDLGRRTSLTLPNGVKTNYTYDNASRLLNLEHLNPAQAILESLSYVYDPNGNRTSTNRQAINLPLPNTVTNTSYNQANQMITFTPSTGSVKNMTYDENGNMTSVTNSCGTTTYDWDARNRLVGIDGYKPDCTPLTASFEYDALGRRIEKTINGRTIQHLYDGLDIVQEIENGVVSVNYIRTLNIDEPLARIKADTAVRYYQTDALGSIIALTDETGAIKTQYTYDPFGNVTISGEASDNPFQYTGRENDETGLYYYRFRYYSPELQRFISEDPIGLLGGINLYSYVRNRPTRYIDQMGLDWRDVLIIIGDIEKRYNLKGPSSVVFTPDIDSETYAKADRWQNEILLPSEDFCKQLDKNAFEQLYQTIYHEMRHLNAPQYQESIDFWFELFIDTGPYHQKIYRDELQVFPSEGLYEKTRR